MSRSPTNSNPSFSTSTCLKSRLFGRVRHDLRLNFLRSFVSRCLLLHVSGRYSRLGFHFSMLDSLCYCWRAWPFPACRLPLSVLTRPWRNDWRKPGLVSGEIQRGFSRSRTTRFHPVLFEVCRFVGFWFPVSTTSGSLSFLLVLCRCSCSRAPVREVLWTLRFRTLCPLVRFFNAVSVMLLSMRLVVSSLARW